jgi:hypothetical protein
MFALIVTHAALLVLSAIIITSSSYSLTSGSRRPERARRIFTALVPTIISALYYVMAMISMVFIMVAVTVATSRDFEMQIFGSGSILPAARIAVVSWLFVHMLAASAVVGGYLLWRPLDGLFDANVQVVAYSFVAFGAVLMAITFGM